MAGRGRHFREADLEAAGSEVDGLSDGLNTDVHGASVRMEAGVLPPRTAVVCAVACVVFVLLEGVYLIAARPATRIVLLVGMSCVSAVGVAVWCVLRGARAGAPDEFARRVFPVLLLGLGLLYLFFFPPNTIPDETYHYGYTYAYANLLDPFMDAQDMRVEDYEFTRHSRIFKKDVDGDFWEDQHAFSLFAAHEGTLLECNVVRPIDFGANPPQVRIAGALGILVGRWLGLSAVVVYYLGRICNFLLGCALVIAAVRLTPAGRNAMMACALLPMTLHLLGSYSYDCGVIGYAFLLTALLLRVLYRAGVASTRLLAACVIAAVVLAPCKVLYYLICLLALAVPRERFGSRGALLAWKASMMVLPLAALLALRLAKMASIAGVGTTSSTVNNRLGEEGRYYTLGEVLAQPVETMIMFLRSFYTYSDSYLGSFVGYRLGWLQMSLESQDVQTFAWVGALLVASLPARGDDVVLSSGLRLLGLAIFVLVVGGAFLTMLLSWTFVTENVILGVQGRYFIPVAPLLLLSLRGRSIAARIHTMPLIAMGMAALNCLYLAQIAFVALGGPLT